MPGRTISHYELLEPLGRGGMGVVHKARDLKLGRVAALKFLSPDLVGSDDARSRFVREARSLSALSHPHIATVYEVDEADGTPFLAMEYLSGGTLRERVASARSSQTLLDTDKLLDWGIDLAEGLSHAHARGIIHRDVKSSNAMFDAEGRVKLTDFGLAKAVMGADANASNSVIGTVEYMSPEQLSGAPIDQRSDLYSLGVVLYELATGQLPFSGSSPVELVNKIVSTDAPKISRARPDVPPAFEAVVDRLLSKSAGSRYQSAQEVLRDLQRVRGGVVDAALLTTRTLPETSRPRAVSWAWMGGGVAVAVAILAYAMWPAPVILPENKHVLVLPLRSIGGDSNQEVLCDGLTETLTTALTQSGLLSVVPASDARKVDTVQQARREYGVNLALYGSLQRRQQQVRLNINLVDATTERQLGAETVDGPADQPLQLEEGMLDKVAALIAVVVPRSEAAGGAGGASPAAGAFDAYLRGRGFLYRYDKEGNLDRALQQFEDATRSDPSFALAYAGLAEAHLGAYRLRRDKESLDAAKAAAERALTLNPSLATAYAIDAAVLAASGRSDAAIAEFEHAIDLDPRDATAYREFGTAYATIGKPERAEEILKKGIRARPGDWLSYSNLAKFYYGQQRYSDAERMYRKVIELVPDNYLGYRNLGGMLIALGRNDEAETLLLKAQSLNPKAKTASNLGTLYMFEQRYRDAVPILEKAAELAPRDAPKEYRIWGNLGDAYWLAGAPVEKSAAAYRHAIEIAEKLRTGSPNPVDIDSVLAEYYAKIGERDRAVERIESALQSAPSSASVRYQAGLVYATLNKDDRALEELKEALTRGFAVDQIKGAPEFKKLRDNPAFAGILAYARTSK